MSLDEESKVLLQKISQSLETIAKFCDIKHKQSEAGKKSAQARKAKYGSSKPTLSRTPSRRCSQDLAKNPEVSQKVRFVLSAYCEAYKARYGINPILQGQSFGMAKSLVKTLSPERLRELVQAYLQMEDPWFKTKCHDFPTFVGNISKVAVSLSNGTSDPHEKDYWRKVFGDGETDLRKTINQNETDLGRKKLSP